MTRNDPDVNTTAISGQGDQAQARITRHRHRTRRGRPKFCAAAVGGTGGCGLARPRKQRKREQDGDARGPNLSASPPVSELSTAGGTDQHRTVTEIASELALNR